MRYSILIFCLFSTQLFAKPIIEQKYKYYVVKPSAQRYLLAELNKMSPVRIDGEVFHAYLDSRIEWQFKWHTDNNGCEIIEVGTRVKLTYTLPKLNSTDPMTNGIWNLWYPKLLNHENGHKANAINIANKIENEIIRLPRAQTCQQLEKNANAVGERLIGELQKMDANYDRDTKHGETQGASLRTYL